VELGRPRPDDDGGCSRGLDGGGELKDVGVDGEPSPYNTDDQIDFCVQIHRNSDTAMQYLLLSDSFKEIAACRAALYPLCTELIIQ